MKKIFTFLLSFLMISGLWAQNQKSLDQARSFVDQNLEELGLTQDDIADYAITDFYTSSNGVTHIYLTQTVDGIPIHNAILNLNIMADGTVPFYGNRFVPNVKEKISSRNFSTQATQAITAVEKVLEVKNNTLLQMKEQKSADHLVFFPTSYAERDIEVKKAFALNADGTVSPAWDVTVKMKDNSDWWSIRVDANTSEVINKLNYTVYCSHASGQYSKTHSAECSDHHSTTTSAKSSSMLMDGSYRVYGLPAESPIHGPHEVVTGAEIEAASPFGWHDVDGVEGAEFTITRGNNVHAYTDKDDSGTSAGDEPDGGDDLIFDFPYDPLAEPAANEFAGVTNLFYMNNMLHDLTYLVGFDEASGNFQRNTYGNAGAGNDAVLAQAADGSGLNNANFATPPDGSSGTMQMFLWERDTNSLVRIDDPVELSGSYEFGATTDDGTWGYANYDAFDIRSNIAIAFDANPSDATQCCDDIVNDADVDGNIALIDRGGCEFGAKALNAQNNGAVACIICNIAGVNGGDGDELNLNLAGGAVGAQVTIPTFMMRRSDCDRIRASINSGIDVTMSIKPEITIGPSLLDAAFDNGIIAHEYGHGISNRLTGGPAAAGCLGNAEQMGEGWSDYFGLVLTIEDGDTGADARGIGTYSLGETVNGRGIRRFPYSTDKAINPQSYDDIKGQTAPHPIGEVWVDCLWDMTWLMIDQYGFDPDWSNTESGNHKAVRLVMDGMKLQPCSPGFIDGRDAILAADAINYQGENTCLIWEAFAGRGVGVGAIQNSSNDANDGTENFDILATCIAQLKIDKTVTQLINPGDDIEVSLLVRNHTAEDIPSVAVTDLLPEGTSLIAGSESMPISSAAGNEIVFDLGAMATLDERTITYRISTPSTNASISLFKDDFESGIDNWSVEFAEGFNVWNLSTAQANSGEFSYNIPDIDTESDSRLVSVPLTVSGTNPVFRFNHKWETESGGDGGFIEISEDGNVWRPVNDLFIRNGYTSIINYGTLAIPDNQAFTGVNLEAWRDSWIDVSDFAGENTQFRFRFATDAVAQGPLPGWFIDDVEIMDLFKYTSTACVNGGEGTQTCTDGVETFVNTDGIVSVQDDIFAENVNMVIYPNPAQDFTSIRLAAKEDINAVLTVTTISGQAVFSNTLSLNKSEQIVNINTADFPKGFYIVKLESGNAVVSKKLVIN